MERVNEHECEFRFGDHGPKYLLRGPRLEWGIIRLQPGQALGPHKHGEVEETFYFEAGTPVMVVNEQHYRVVAGDAFRLEPGESHNIVNDTDTLAHIIFIKCPYLPGDKIEVEPA